jgi:hypothetical protein
MPAEQADDRMIADKKAWLRRLVWIIGSIIIVMLLIFIVAKVWLVPVVIRYKVERRLSKLCEGPVEVESVKANYSGQLFLKGIKFYNKAEREWLFAEKVKANLTNWPGLNPAITEIEIDGLNVKLFVTDGKFNLPLARPSRQSTSSNRKFDIQKITIKEASISVSNEHDSTIKYDSIQLSATKRENFYDILLKRLSPQPLELFVAKGTINSRSLQADLSVQMEHTFNKAEMSELMAVLNQPNISAEGKVSGDLTITGILKEPTVLQRKGIIKLDDWTVERNNNLIAQNITTYIKLDNQNLDFENITANLCKGWINGSLYAKLRQNQPIDLSGQILAMKIDLAELTTMLAAKKKAEKGAMTLNYKFTADSNDLKNLRGEGLVFLDDADISVLPVIPNIFSAVGLSSYDPLTMSDAQATFTMAGPVVTIKGAHIANRFAAIKAEPGGTVNLQTKHIDAHVVATPLKQLDLLLRSVPIVDIFANLKDKLTRLHIEGQWSDPPKKLITKEPIKDIKDGTVGFLQDVVKSGGQFSEATLGKFGTLFKNKQNDKK